MKSFQRFALSLVVCSFTHFALAQDGSTTAAPASGQQGGAHRGPRIGERFDHIADALGLTDPQKSQIRDIFKSHHSELQSIRQDQSLTKEQKMEKARQVFQSIHEQARPILTPEQQQKWAQMKDQWKEKRAARHGTT